MQLSSGADGFCTLLLLCLPHYISRSVLGLLCDRPIYPCETYTFNRGVALIVSSRPPFRAYPMSMFFICSVSVSNSSSVFSQIGGVFFVNTKGTLDVPCYLTKGTLDVTLQDVDHNSPGTFGRHRLPLQCSDPWRVTWFYSWLKAIDRGMEGWGIDQRIKFCSVKTCSYICLYPNVVCEF